MDQYPCYNNPPIKEALCEFHFKPKRDWDLTLPGSLQSALGQEYTGKPHEQRVIAFGVEDMVALDKQWMQLQDALLVAFEIDPPEDGMDHPAERILTDALHSGEEDRVLAWIREFALDAAHPNFAASVLRCLGHHRVGTSAWRTRLVRNALALDEVEIRDAAVQAAALWGNREMRCVLAAHDEPISWLGTYIQDVIEDLGA